MKTRPIDGTSKGLNEYIFVLPGHTSDRSGADMALEVADNILSESENGDSMFLKTEFTSVLLKLKAKIGILNQPVNFIGDIPLINQDDDF